MVWSPATAITGFFQLEQRPDLLDGKAFALPTGLRFEKVDVHRPHAGQPQHPQVEIAVLINQDSAVVVAALPDHRALNNDLPNMITARRTARPRRILRTASARVRRLEAEATTLKAKVSCDRSNHHRVGQNRPERLHHIERQGRPAVARLVIKAAVRVEADRRQCRRQFPYQHSIGKGQHRVDRIRRRPSVAVLEFETRQLSAIPIAAAQHRTKAIEINGRTIALHAKEFAEVFRLTHCLGCAPEPAQSRVRRPAACRGRSGAR
jgi:hypothetical protein